MAMAVDSRQQFNTMGYDQMRFHAQPPQFTNPWAATGAQQQQLYQASMPQQSLDYKTQLPSTTYAAAPSSTYTSAYTSAPAQMASYAPTAAAAAAQYSSAYAYQPDRRTSHPLQGATDAERQSFNDALDASRGMVAMSQSDITPRNIYGTNSARSSMDSYGFPVTHSSASSISSASTYPTYYNSSVSEASTGDYGSASESVDMPTSRTLPRPTGLLGAMPPAPQSMMGQFSSKVSSSSQKKHKCKVCEKRFTRPSSLQTHMYSHTGEKRKSELLRPPSIAC